MEERISQVLNGTQFFDFGTVIFASNHPDHVYLLEVQKDEENIYTVLYDKKHDYLNINKHDNFRNPHLDENTFTEHVNIELTDEQSQEIKHLLEASGNNVE